VNIGILSDLRMDPFVNKDNLLLNDVDCVIKELKEFKELGGTTIVDPTNIGIGRDPVIIKRIADETNLNIILGSGFYLEPTHPDYVKRMNEEDISQWIQQEYYEGIDGSGVKIGIVGEIGISKDFTVEERKVLTGASRAAAFTGVPLSVHLPGWERLGGNVLDVAYENGCREGQVVLCHMNPSFDDLQYQMDLAERGAWIEYDMIGMDFFYSDQSAQCPYDTENANAIKKLVDEGFGHRILLSQDVFIKMMLKSYGGNGYSYILKYFKDRLIRSGLTNEQFMSIMINNPKACFEALN
jgi:phosphotriesterase-related protein